MRLTDAQRAVVTEETRSVLVTACPGSGKTRTIVARLVRAIEQVRGTPRRLACITYTNAGANEIDRRIRSSVGSEDAAYCEIGTIHAFCLKAVLGLFHAKIPGLTSGVAVAPPDSEPFSRAAERAAIASGLGRRVRPADFENIRRGVDGEPLLPEGTPLTVQCVRAFWDHLREGGYVDFNGITYHAYRLLFEHPHIARTISSRFREILVDEMQDTDWLQARLLARIADAGETRFVFVGDPMQSILGFAGAEPERMFELAEDVSAIEAGGLVSNWRSSARIVRVAEALCPREPAMHASGAWRDWEARPVVITSPTAESAVVEQFLPLLEREGIPTTSAAVLAPAWYMLVPIARELRRMGVPVSGPGSRPYQRRGRLLTGLLESVCSCASETLPHMLPRIQREIQELMQQLGSRFEHEAWTRPGRIAAMRLIFRARELRDSHPLAVDWINSAVPAFGEILSDCGLMGSGSSRRLADAGAAIVGEIRANRDFDAGGLRVEDLGIFANPQGSLSLLTLHSAKGREFDAVCIVELQEGSFPHPRADLDEARRVLYVGTTRARKVLLFAHRESGARCQFLLAPEVARCLG